MASATTSWAMGSWTSVPGSTPSIVTKINVGGVATTVSRKTFSGTVLVSKTLS